MSSVAIHRPSAQQLNRSKFDLIVIGGGITGAGVAQDAASRGMEVLLLEKGDFASGTSSKSTKLIHGGLRYLQNLQFDVVHESLHERQLQMQLAPHLVRPVPFVIPLYRGKRVNNVKLAAGLWLYDFMAGFRNHQWHKRISADEVRSLCPGVKQDGLIGGFAFSDCRTDDARHTLEVIKAAVAHGATAANYVRVIELLYNSSGNVDGIRATRRDHCGQWSAPFDIHASVVVQATGVWTQQFSASAGENSAVNISPAKGVHITVSPARLPLKSATIIPSAHDKRFCFAVPWYDSILIGTTDTEYSGNLDELSADVAEIDYILDAVNAQFPAVRLTRDDITGSFAGARPLVKGGHKGNTTELSRKHILQISASGLITVSGGKLTTYRLMARDAVDAVAQRLPDTQRIAIRSCRTHETRLGGFSLEQDVSGTIAALQSQAQALGLSADTATYLPTVYGAATQELLNIIKAQPSMGERLCDKHPYIGAQVVYALTHESALTIDDVLSRRIRLSITDRAAATDAAAAVASMFAVHFGWNAERITEEVANYLGKQGDNG